MNYMKMIIVHFYIQHILHVDDLFYDIYRDSKFLMEN